MVVHPDSHPDNSLLVDSSIVENSGPLPLSFVEKADVLYHRSHHVFKITDSKPGFEVVLLYSLVCFDVFVVVEGPDGARLVRTAVEAVSMVVDFNGLRGIDEERNFAE